MTPTVPPYIPESAPFSLEQRAWLNGFLAGMFSSGANGATPQTQDALPAGNAGPLLICFGSQTGAAEGLAKKLAKESAKRGFAPQLHPLNDFETANFAAAKKTVIVSSTWGDGDPPDNAVKFWNWLKADGAPRLEHLEFAVLGLGDKNYSDFCGASKKIDARLDALGAKRLLPRGECDTDYEAVAKQWIDGLWEKLGGSNGASNGDATTNGSVAQNGAGETPALLYSKAHPFPARLLKNLPLNRPGSGKEVRHYEISLGGSGLAYEVGDALGVMPENCAELVSEVLAALEATGDEPVALENAVVPLRLALAQNFELGRPTQELLEAIAKPAAASPPPLGGERARVRGEAGIISEPSNVNATPSPTDVQFPQDAVSVLPSSGGHDGGEIPPSDARIESLNRGGPSAGKLPIRGNEFSLSPGERAGVRADFPPSPISLRVHDEGGLPSNSNNLSSNLGRGIGELAPLLAPERAADLKKWLHGRDVLDMLLLAPRTLTVVELLPLLRKLSPRLYSISSSPKAHPGEVHLTVGAVRYEAHSRARKGVASTFLADRAGDIVKIFVNPSHGFRPPASGDAPMMMVGPGTGIAPFRAFLEEREATGAKGKNWLFFGDQKRAADFLYEEQLTAWHKSGFLTRLDLAFSRDQAEKVYVQDRMLQNAAEFWSWLEAGGHFYVCGDASRMAKDVDAALHKIIETAGGKSVEEAKTYVEKMKTEKRYQRDVY